MALSNFPWPPKLRIELKFLCVVVEDVFHWQLHNFGKPTTGGNTDFSVMGALGLSPDAGLSMDIFIFQW